jgi:transcriptional regulator with XRE-family HTH domain
MAPRVRGLSKSVHSALQEAFCTLMRDARHRADLTQQELALLLGKPQSFVAKYETGERRLDVIEYVHILQVMDQDPVGALRALLRKAG